MQVDFYTLASADRDNFFKFVAKLARQIYYKNLTIYIASDSVSDLHFLNELLWQMQPSDFLVHDLAETQADIKDAEVKNLIVLGLVEQIDEQKDVCINLSAKSLIDYADKFNRLVEVAFNTDDILQAKRDNWQAYQNAKFHIKHHKIN